MNEDMIDAVAYFMKSNAVEPMKFIPCEGVGDNNGFWEFTPSK